MDDDSDLIIRLCTRAGMIMEDVSLLAVTMPSQQEMTRLSALVELSGATHTMTALIAAAIALEQQIKR